jgi:hypothetical protein
MDETIHIIPVGFDFQRLAQPITQGDIDADRVLLLHSSRESSNPESQELAERMVERLEETLGTLFGKDVDRRSFKNIFDFETAYTKAYRMIKEEVQDGNTVWVNISSMPRTVAFAFASAANSLVVEEPDFRNKVHTYYVSTEEYIVTQMIQELKKEKKFLEKISDKHPEDQDIKDRLDSIASLVSDVQNNGTTKGADQIVEFPVVPVAELHEFEIKILRFLKSNGTQESISSLAKNIAQKEPGNIDIDSFKSKVQYNVKNLEEQGFVKRESIKNRHKISLDTMGKLWVNTHEPNQQ